VKKADVIEWLEAWPVTNECTHYAVVLDPKKGGIVWLKRFSEPVEDSSTSDDSTSDDDYSEL